MRALCTVLDAWKNSGLTIEGLLKATDLTMDRSTLHRKLHGKSPISIKELEELARVFGLRIVAHKAKRVALESAKAEPVR